MKTNTLLPMLAVALALNCGVGHTQCLNPYPVNTVQSAPGSTTWIQLFANQLDHTPNNIYTNWIDPTLPISSKVWRWDSSVGYTVGTKKGNGAWSAGFAINPGEGAYLTGPGSTPPAITIAGTERLTETPVTITPGNWYLISRQKNCPASYDDIVNRLGGGSPPYDGLALYRLRQSFPLQGAPVGVDFSPTTWSPAYEIFVYRSGNWFPFSPVMRVGEAVWLGPETESIAGTARKYTGSCPATGGKLRDWQIHLTGSPTVGGTVTLDTLTDADGNYQFHVPPGTYTVSQVPDACWIPTCPTTPFTHTVIVNPGNHITGRDFGAQAVSAGSLADLSVQVFATYDAPYTSPCCGQYVHYRVCYRNTCQPQSNVKLRFTLPAQTSFYAPGSAAGWAPVSLGSSTYRLVLGSLGVGAVGQKIITVKVDGAGCTQVEPRTLLSALAEIRPNNSSLDANTANNTDTLDTLVTCSYDPNDKEVSPKGCGPTGLINSQPLTYTIHFQNLGSGPAYEVQVHDQLDPSLDPNTVQILGSSHNYTYTLNGTEMVWTFPNILLPAAVADEPGSHGFISYRVNPLPSLAEGTMITNQAAIYFDSNPPVLTPTTTNTITSDVLAVASFSVTPRARSAGHTNDFTYTGGTAGATFLWDFGTGATPATSTNMDPTGVVFAADGLRPVSLRVSQGGCDPAIATAQVKVGAPQLELEVIDDLACLSWEGAGYLLQEAESLTGPVNWQTINPPTSLSGSTYSTGLSPTNGMRFYRLVDQP